MRTVTHGGAVSLDGFLAGVDGSIDWLHDSKDVQQEMTDYLKNLDTILMGRKTHEVAAAAVAGEPKRDTRKNPPAMITYVFSLTLKRIDEPNTELVTGNMVEFVRALKRTPVKDVCLMSGGGLTQLLLAAGLVDQIRLNIHPILLGSGSESGSGTKAGDPTLDPAA